MLEYRVLLFLQLILLAFDFDTFLKYSEVWHLVDADFSSGEVTLTKIKFAEV